MASRLVAPETHLFGKEDGTELHDSDEIRLRAFRPDGEDESQMRELMFDNAFLGEPFDVICPCKEWFSDVVLTPYIKYQPENIQVAVHRPSGRLIGYLTGSLGGQELEGLQYKLVKKKVISLALSLTMPWTFFDLSSRLFATHVIFRGEGERPSHPETGVHWNFQVAKDFRGHGIGTKLLRRFVHDALEADFRLIWAEVMAYPEKPPQYFGDRGWLIYDAKPTGIFGDHVDFPVQVMCITQPLSSLAVLTHPA
jgi:ribosomal protein S18 acetylase RimI-like enzyme